MPFAALVAALLVVAMPFDPSAAGSPSKPLFTPQTPASPMLAFDDELYDDRNDDDDGAFSEGPDFNYGLGDEDNDDEDNSAHGPEDDQDDGWYIDAYPRSERA